MGKLTGTIDMHIHGSPDIVPRKLSDIEIVQDAINAEMSAVVLKTHLGSTVERALLVDEITGHKIRVLGGIALNSFIGGFNILAVKAALLMGAKIVWMPTFTAKTHLDYERKNNKSVNTLSTLCKNLTGLTVLKENGNIKDKVIEILKLVSEKNIVLGCGHIGIYESKKLIPIAKQCGVQKIIYNHPNNPINPVSLEDQKWLVNQHVLLERCIVDIIQGLTTWEAVIAEIRATGIENNIISTDLGQFKNMTPVAGMELAYDKLVEYGFTENEIQLLISENPKRMLNI